MLYLNKDFLKFLKKNNYMPSDTNMLLAELTL